MQNCLLIFIIVMNIIFANGHVYVQNIKQMQLKLHEPAPNTNSISAYFWSVVDKKTLGSNITEL